MNNVVNLNARRLESSLEYRHGDLCQALRLALEDEDISEEIEETLAGLLFHHTEEDTVSTRELLSDMLEALPTGAL